MQGLLSDLPLVSVLELIHTTRQTGVLDVQSEIPYTVAFAQGEIISGGILDWLGFEALQCCPLMPTRGRFDFEMKSVTGTPLGSYDYLTTEWARVSDEWEEICVYITSPSRLFTGDLPLFNEPGGRSVRAAARKADKPLIEMAQYVADAVMAKQLQPLNRYAWFGLLLNSDLRKPIDHPFSVNLGSGLNIGEIIAQGESIDMARDYLLLALQKGMRFQGSGWVLRDLIWETRFA